MSYFCESVKKPEHVKTIKFGMLQTKWYLLGCLDHETNSYMTNNDAATFKFTVSLFKPPLVVSLTHSMIWFCSLIAAVS